MRCFISLDIPKEVLKKIREIQEKLPEFIGRKTEEENLHLTLKFLGEIDENKAEKIRKKLEKIKFPKFEVRIESIGIFSGELMKIIWLRLANCDELQKEIDKKLKGSFKPEQRFMSHLTIARVKRIKDRKKFLEELNKSKPFKIKFIAESFSLVKSELTRERLEYEISETYKLKKYR